MTTNYGTAPAEPFLGFCLAYYIRPPYDRSCSKLPCCDYPSAIRCCFHPMSLPSFVELMSSLGLEDASRPHNVRSFLRPRSHSNASSSSDDEREHSPRQYTPSGTYLFVPADYDRRDSSSLTDTDAPRVSRHSKGRYSPYPTDSVRTNPS